MGFNPNKHTPTKGQADFDDREIPAGVYLMIPRWLKCPTEKSWKARFDVLMGPFEGASAFILQGRDVSKEGTANRLYYYSQSAGIDAELETQSRGSMEIITEHAIREHVLGRAIKGKVTRKPARGDYPPDYDFANFHARDEWSARELDVAAKAEAEYVAEREARGGDYGGDSDWGDGGSQGGADPMGGNFGGDPGPTSEWDDDWGQR